MTVRVGFFGAGFISRFHAASLGASKVEHEIVAVHDPDAGRAAAFAADNGGAVVGEDELLDARRRCRTSPRGRPSTRGS